MCVHTGVCQRDREREESGTLLQNPLPFRSPAISLRSGEQFQQLHWVGRGLLSPLPSLQTCLL